MNHQKLWQFVKNDTRTPTEIFNELRQQMHNISGGKLNDKESIEAVRNLIGFCEAIMGLSSGKRGVDTSTNRMNIGIEVKSDLET